jgi:Tfp pilus assembly protein PilF
MSPLRMIIAVPVVIALATAANYAVWRGASDDLAYGASIEMATWVSSRSQPGDPTWNWVRSDLERAVSMAKDPTSHELLGALLAMRSERSDLNSMARKHFIEALTTRPTSGNAWANLGDLYYRQGMTGAAFEAALRSAAEFGPSEPQVQRAVGNLGLAVYDEVTADTKSAIERMVRAGLRRNPSEMLQISVRRGRLDVACRHTQGIQSGAHQQWLQLCQSREATS